MYFVLSFPVLPRINFLTPDRSVKQGNSTALECDVSGDPAPRVRWVHKDTCTTIANFSHTSLNITGKASGGQYCCHASNGYGDATNCTSVKVTEYQPINTKLISCITFLTRNKTFKISCSADASPPAEYFIQTGNSAKVNSSDGNVTITTPVDGTSINISCIAKNKYGKGNATYLQIPIYEPPTIVTHWDKTVVMMNESFTFHCEATGFPTPNITWYNAKDNENVSSENGRLKVKNKDCKNETLEYYCIAVNIVKRATTHLTVQAICKKDKSADNGDDKSDNRLKIIIAVIVCGLVLVIFILLFILISRKRKWPKRDVIEGTQQGKRQNQEVEEDPYGEPVDAIQVRSVGLVSASNADYATVEETGYRRVNTSNHLQEPQYRGVASSKKTKPVVEPVYAKVNKKNKKKDTSADMPLNPLYAEIPGNILKASPKQNPKTNNEEEDGVDSAQESWFGVFGL